MDFDWTTVILEILNFLVLIWLLKRFFYKPVLAVIEQRRAASEQIIAAAAAQRQAAEALKSDYEQRLARTVGERELAMQRLDEEIAAERARRLAVIEKEAEVERQRLQMLEARAVRERETAMEHHAVKIAARFASRFLEGLVGPEAETKLVDLALTELSAAPAESLRELRLVLHDPAAKLRVFTVYPLDTARRGNFTRLLSAFAGYAVTPEFAQDPALRCGLSLTAGSWVLAANLRDELAFFADTVEHG